MKKLVVIDGYAMMFRSYYAVKFGPKFEGKSIGMVFGCGSTILQTLEQFKPDYFCIAFDCKEKTFRHEKDPNYKAQRTKAPDDFYEQIPLLMEMVDTMNIPTLKKPGFEADDIIGTLARQAEQKEIETYILSGDLDFLQLISPSIHLAKFNGKEPLIFNRELTFQKMKVWPEQIIDYKSIAGDSSDNYKGLTGVGPKTTANLLKEYKTLDNIYQNLNQLKPKLKEKFEADREYVAHCKFLAEIHTKVPIDFTFNKEQEFQYNSEVFRTFFEKINCWSLSTRAQNMNNKIDQTTKIEQKNRTKKHEDNAQTSLF